MLRNLKYNVIYLPGYSPCLAPIEMTFSYIKHILKQECKAKVINLATKDGANEVAKALGNLTGSKIRDYFKQFLKEVKEQL